MSRNTTNLDSSINIHPQDIGKLKYDAKKRLAQDTATSPKILNQLASDKSRNIRKIVACNPRTPPEALDRLADDVRVVQRGVDLNPNASSKTLDRLAGRRPANVIRNPSAPKHILDTYAKHPFSHYRRYVAENSGTDPSTLNKLLGDEALEVREAVQRNPSFIGSILRRVSIGTLSEKAGTL
ncbi:MAG: hypothetical protein FWD64_03725 [Acidobacteriaceae bacterium]|nr:hypothetical protein [Acidobacteriaceae bacterium]